MFNKIIIMYKPSFTQFVCLSGLPRSGSTLLSAILSQNPKIHAEGNSAVCQLMWDCHVTCNTTANEQLRANNRDKTKDDLISSIPHIYYKDISEKIVVDKCRSWTLQPNIDLLKKYIDKNIKIIILTRPINEIVKSFIKLNKKNNIKVAEINIDDTFLKHNSEPIMRSFNGVLYAKNNNMNNNFLFITYNDLVKNTEETIKKIYDFCNWEYYQHDLKNIIAKYPENDEIYKLKEMHSIRPIIKIEENKINLPDYIINYSFLGLTPSLEQIFPIILLL